MIITSASFLILMQFKCQFYANFWLNSYVTLSGNYLTMMHNKILLSKSVVEYLISKLLRNKDNFLYETLISWKTDPFLLMKTTLKKPWRSEEVYRRRWNVRGSMLWQSTWVWQSICERFSNLLIICKMPGKITKNLNISRTWKAF